MTTHPSATTIRNEGAATAPAALGWQEELIQHAWLYSKSVDDAQGKIRQAAIAINKGSALSAKEQNELEEALYTFETAVAELVSALYPVTYRRAQEIAHTLPHPGGGRQVGLEEMSDNADDLPRVMRGLFKEAGIVKDFTVTAGEVRP